MKLATVRIPNRQGARPVAAANGGLLDLAERCGVGSIKSLLAEGEIGLMKARDALARAKAADFVSVEQVSFLPPIPDPDKFLCVGKNYREHLDELVRTELIKELPTEPTGFIKLNSVMVGHEANVRRPQGIVQFDYEPELTFVIGRPAYRVSKQDAMSYVAGVTVFNDLTAREIQRREVKSGTRFWTAKNMPGFGPIGPYIVTMDEIVDVNDLWLTCSVNGFTRSRFNTNGQIFKIPDIIEHFSRYLPLETCDMFATGSAGGIAAAQENADELFLKPGDVIDVTIEGVMSLRTHIEEERG